MTLTQATEIINGGIVRPTPANARFDPALISPHIKDAERAHIVPVLGADLYAYLLAKKNATPCNYNPVLGTIVKAFPDNADAALEALWVEHLYELTAWAVMYEALPFIGLQTSSAGVMSINSEYSNNEGVKGVAYTQDNMRRRLEIKTEALSAYLCANKADFPQYDATKCPDASCGEQPVKNRLKRFGITYVTND